MSSSLDPQSSITLLLNHRASNDREFLDILNHLGSSDPRLRVVHPHDGQEVSAMAEDAARNGAHAVVAVGGDGTLNAIINGVLASESECAVGVIPFGTANDFATASGITHLAIDEQLKLIQETTPIPIDVGRVNDRHFINVASGGFGAEVTSETSDTLKELLGSLAYSLTGMVKAVAREERQVTVCGPEFDWDGFLLFLTVANSRLAGGGYVVAPTASLTDGFFDVVIIPEVDLLDLPDLIGDILAQDHADSEIAQRMQVPWLEIEVQGSIPLPLNLDGEPHHSSRMRFEIVPHRLPFYLPPLNPSEPPPLWERKGSAR